MPEVGLPGLVTVKERLSLFNDIACRKVVGRGSVIADLLKVAPGIIDNATVYYDGTKEVSEGIPLRLAKGQKFPIDFAAVFEDNGYLIVKGKAVFGAISEVEGHALTERIIANILRNYS